MRKRYLLLVTAVIFGIALLAVERYTGELVTAENQTAIDEPDYYGEGLNHRQYNQSGQLAQQLQAAASRHLPDQAVSYLDQPVIINRDSSQQQWQVSADKGTIADQNTQVQLSGNVNIASLTDAGLRVTTQQLQYSPDQATASTDDWVTIQNGSSETRARGMTMDINRQRLDLKQQVSTRYVQD
ncbi:LPS export ABC transporter periplasmic protein LptC [Oceanobacter mangrovi]|uniref:LPS export ABC transporter periplasmic protein LptC n=1 Tax=Oceanobacter mangrovi TaxID=2862510 RepID=UPI001C8E5559|nr:LPS export ABC transporter periplasmic protein LptC [Oceanobacter mangrovi]